MTYPSFMKSFFLVLMLAVAPAVCAQENNNDAARQKTRDRLNTLLQRIGPELKISFTQSDKNPFAFTGNLTDGLKNASSFEVVLRITTNETIAIKAFPHYKNGYINIDKARNTTQMLRQMVQFNETTFLFWGADDTGDVFAGYTFTLESGFPDEGIRIVLASIKNSDEYIGKLRPSIDGTNP